MKQISYKKKNSPSGHIALQDISITAPGQKQRTRTLSPVSFAVFFVMFLFASLGFLLCVQGVSLPAYPGKIYRYGLWAAAFCPVFFYLRNSRFPVFFCIFFPMVFCFVFFCFYSVRIFLTRSLPVRTILSGKQKAFISSDSLLPQVWSRVPRIPV